MKVIGITGGVGAGKSTVLNYIKEHYRVRILTADEIAHDVMEPGGRCYRELRAMFPAEVFGGDGSIDRKKFAQVIFENDRLRDRMNALVHPAVGLTIKEEVAREKAESRVEYCFVEAALFDDLAREGICDEVWYVDTSEECRKERLMRDRGYSSEKVDAILRSQEAQKAFALQCDVIIHNGKDFTETIREVEEALHPT